MKCPSCGTLVQDGLDVCPACHASLVAMHTEVAPDVTWCESCGSAIPMGVRACPACGMPVAGAYDDEYEEEPKEEAAESEVSSLVSAIPPEPTENPEQPTRNPEDKQRRMRHLLIATVAALVLVGGGTLFITRPWDPAAYSIHATEDADTSMEGFPGTVTHLSSQDHVEDAAWKAYLSDAQGFLERFRDRMGTMANNADVLYELLPGGTAAGDYARVHDRALAAQKMREELEGTTRIATRLVLPDTSLDAYRDSLIVVASYLGGELDTLNKAWMAADAAQSEEDASEEVRIALRRSSDQHDFGEWQSLFRNSYESIRSDGS